MVNALMPFKNSEVSCSSRAFVNVHGAVKVSPLTLGD
jgi:hypothetical protein